MNDLGAFASDCMKLALKALVGFVLLYGIFFATVFVVALLLLF